MRRICVLCVALAMVTAGLGAVAGSASGLKKTVHLWRHPCKTCTEETEAITVGERVDLAPQGSVSLTSSTSSRIINCPESTPVLSGIEGKDLTNGEPMDLIETAAGHGNLASTFAEPACGDTETVALTGVKLSAAGMALSFAPEKGKAMLKPTTGKILLTVETTAPPLQRCEYEAKKMKGTATNNGVLNATFTAQKFKLLQTLEGECQKKWLFSGSFVGVSKGGSTFEPKETWNANSASETQVDYTLE